MICAGHGMDIFCQVRCLVHCTKVEDLQVGLTAVYFLVGKWWSVVLCVLCFVYDVWNDCDVTGLVWRHCQDSQQTRGYIWPARTINIPSLDWPDRKQSDHIMMQHPHGPLQPSLCLSFIASNISAKYETYFKKENNHKRIFSIFKLTWYLFSTVLQQ